MARKLWRLPALLTVLLAVTGKSAETLIPTPYLQESSETLPYKIAVYTVYIPKILILLRITEYIRVNWSHKDKYICIYTRINTVICKFEYVVNSIIIGLYQLEETAGQTKYPAISSLSLRVTAN